MKGDPKVIELLNEALKEELTAINQYWLHYRMLDNWGIKKLAEYERHESIDEMKHADTLADRILFLEGLPNFQALHKLKVGETVEEILKADLALELEALPLLKDAIQHCETVRDYISREIFERILESEEEHVEALETCTRANGNTQHAGANNAVSIDLEPVRPPGSDRGRKPFEHVLVRGSWTEILAMNPGSGDGTCGTWPLHRGEVAVS